MGTVLYLAIDLDVNIASIVTLTLLERNCWLHQYRVKYEKYCNKGILQSLEWCTKKKASHLICGNWSRLHKRQGIWEPSKISKISPNREGKLFLWKINLGQVIEACQHKEFAGNRILYSVARVQDSWRKGLRSEVRARDWGLCVKCLITC